MGLEELIICRAEQRGEMRGKAEGIAEGQQNTLRETAKVMKADKFPTETIMKYTKLTAQEIEKL